MVRTLSQKAFGSVGVCSPLPAEDEGAMSPLVVGDASSGSYRTRKRSKVWHTSFKAWALSRSLVVWNGDGQSHTREL